jgi:hypothetical protein
VAPDGIVDLAEVPFGPIGALDRQCIPARETFPRRWIAQPDAVGAREAVYLDVPEGNAAGLALAETFAVTQMFGTTRICTGLPPAIDLDRVFGVTTFELD